jgi:hypothetical protein
MDNTAEITPEMRRFARKVRWEGGILDAIDYGLTAADVPDEAVASTWAEIESLYSRMRPLISAIEPLLEAA